MDRQAEPSRHQTPDQAPPAGAITGYEETR